MGNVLKEIVPFLMDWFDYNARILPWRQDPKPYNTWISEIMLQQTRVEAVKGYYERFISELPNVKALAKADDEKLLKLWEGLGYYSRVRNIKKAALMIMEDYHGELPSDYDSLRKLPGIGVYTAGAIASMAFGAPIPAVDGNVLRVMKRVEGSFDDITRESVKRKLGNSLSEVIPKDRPGRFNQAVMDLGATICIPNGKPLCDQCPLMHLCKAFKQDIAMQLPVKPAKKGRRVEDRTILAVEYQSRFAIRKRKDKGLLAGLWELPSLEGNLKREDILSLGNEMGFDIEDIEALGKAKHIFSHIEWHMVGYHVILKTEPKLVLPEKKSEDVSNPFLWAGRDELNAIYTFPSAFSAYSDLWAFEQGESR